MAAPQLYLASRSPRRQELLRQVGIHFELIDAGVEERRLPGMSPAQYAVATALAKAHAAAARAARALPVLGADTDVVVDDEILGKPADRNDAIRMLRRLSNREHDVFSAVAVVQGARERSALSVTRVHFGEISERDAGAYWDSGESAGKAGAYAIQGLGARFVRSIEGSYSGVVGLPLFETCQLLEDFSIFPLTPNP